MGQKMAKFAIVMKNKMISAVIVEVIGTSITILFYSGIYIHFNYWLFISQIMFVIDIIFIFFIALSESIIWLSDITHIVVMRSSQKKTVIIYIKQVRVYKLMFTAFTGLQNA